jgi:hypothetical protein
MSTAIEARELEVLRAVADEADKLRAMIASHDGDEIEWLYDAYTVSVQIEKLDEALEEWAEIDGRETE